jgi:rRNA maturation endonuclease Nob1
MSLGRGDAAIAMNSANQVTVTFTAEDLAALVLLCSDCMRIAEDISDECCHECGEQLVGRVPRRLPPTHAGIRAEPLIFL